MKVTLTLKLACLWVTFIPLEGAMHATGGEGSAQVIPEYEFFDLEQQLALHNAMQ